ncbi:NADPH--cytochrome P450 reductase, putative [Plasmodium ovale]|uniref:NADPH--cytochrome P450 reductase, putative n=1 Tax=Plasmodium ovale TaxID=36330 RepID=A0A1C3KW53_PLAOA|nr:NADPH--cytochrome P450 reductase, putative [Plasmodium ovale]
MEATMKRRRILLAYGSEFGTAYDCGRNVFYELYPHFNIDFFCLNDIHVTTFYNYENVIMIVSTTGYGCYTHDISKFWIDLHKNNYIFYEDMYFHIFGLGDSSYDNYNVVAKKLKKKLKSLGAHIANYNLGNYQHPSMHFTNFDIWKKNVYDFLRKKYFYFQVVSDIPCVYSVLKVDSSLEGEHESSWKDKSANWEASKGEEANREEARGEEANGEEANGEEANGKEANGKEANEEEIEAENGDRNSVREKTNPAAVDHYNVGEHFCKSLQFTKFEVVKNERCTDRSYYQDVRLIHLIAPLNHFNVSSLIRIHPFLDEKRTKEILNLLKINYNDYIIIKKNDINCIFNTYIPTKKKIKILDLFMHFLDLNKIVTPFFFIYLSKKTNSEIHKKKFLQLGNTNNISDYFGYIYQDKRSYYDIFYDFYSYINIDITFLLNTLPSIKQRAYSILNTSQCYKLFKNFNFFNLYYFYINPSFSTFIHFLKINYYLKKNPPNFFSFYTYNGLMVKSAIRTLKYINWLRYKIEHNNNTLFELLVCLYHIDVNQNKKLKGLCSDYLINSKPGSFIYATIQNSLITMNKNIGNINYRIVYISIGAAFSSLLGVIRLRDHLYRKHDTKWEKKIHPMDYSTDKDIIFLGLRNRDKDFYFQQEMENYLHFNYIFVAFSRQPENRFFFFNKEVSQLAPGGETNIDFPHGIPASDASSAAPDVDAHASCVAERTLANRRLRCATRVCEEKAFNMSYAQMKHLLEEKKKVYVTDIISVLQDSVYELLKKNNTIILVAGKSRPFSQNVMKLFANIIKQKEQNKTMEEINLFLKKKMDDFSIILESWY